MDTGGGLAGVNSEGVVMIRLIWSSLSSRILNFAPSSSVLFDIGFA